MQRLLFTFILAAHLPARAQESAPTAPELVHEVAVRFAQVRSPRDIQETLRSIEALSIYIEQDITVRRELENACQADPRILLELLEVAEKPEAGMNPAVQNLLYYAIRTTTMPVLLQELQKPGLSASAILNLLSVFQRWVIRDKEISSHIRASLNELEHKVKEDGYIFGLRLGRRFYTDNEEAALIQAIRLIKAKNIAKLTP